MDSNISRRVYPVNDVTVLNVYRRISRGGFDPDLVAYNVLIFVGFVKLFFYVSIKIY